MLSRPLVKVLQEFTQKSPIYLVNQTDPIDIAKNSCKGLCATTVTGAGLNVTCTTSSSPYAYTFTNGKEEHDKKGVEGIDFFGTYLSWPTGAWAAPSFNLSIQYKSTPECAGNLVVKNCTMTPAIVNYPVIVDGNKSSIVLKPGIDSLTNATIKLTNIEQEENVKQPFTTELYNASTYGGIFKALSDTYGSSIRMKYEFFEYPTSGTYQVVTQGAIGQGYIDSTSMNCTMVFKDPTADILAGVRELMFRTAIASANESFPADIQRVTAVDSIETQVFKSTYLYLVIGVSVSLAAWLATSLVFFGWWNLGRTASLNPIEIAKAFGAPGLRSEDANAEAEELIKEIGTRQVRYGAISSGRDGEGSMELARLGMGRPKHVRMPRPGEHFSYTAWEDL